MSLGWLLEMLGGALLPDVISYAAAISASEKGMQWLAALASWQQMPRRQLQPHVISCSAAIRVREKGM